MTKSQKTKQQQKIVRETNPFETGKDIGKDVIDQLENNLLKGMGGDVLRQILSHDQKHSGEITPGESLEFNEIYSGEYEKKEEQNKQIKFEKELFVEEKELYEKKIKELRLQLKAIMDEVLALSQTTQGLAQETQIAAFQAPANPGVYHVIFFEKLLEFLKSFRKKIESSYVWLNATNKRAQKKNFWATFKGKGGAKFLLSSESYSQRSAG